MRCLVQKVSNANVKVGDDIISSINHGLLIFICAMEGDNSIDAEKMALKISKLRIFHDQNNKMNRTIKDVQGDVLIVSQFTLAADTSRGNRPGFSSAAPPEKAEKLYDLFVSYLEEHEIICKKGIFGANMKVSLINDGPTTIWIENESCGTKKI